MGYKLYKGSQLIKKVFKGGTAVKKIYKGSTLIWQADPYEPGTTLFNKTGANTYTATLPEGVYDLVIAGSGGRTNRWAFNYVWYYAKGGSGAAWEGQFYNPKDQQIKIYAGGQQEASYMELGGVRMITVNQGSNGSGTSAGSGGTVSVNSALQVTQTRKSAKGTDGISGTADGNWVAASVCSLNSWGQGASNGDNEIAGGARLQYIRMDK